MNQDCQYIASNIKVLREEARLTIEQFAAKAGVSVDTVIGWEKGTLKVYTKDLLIICPILRISEEDIRTRDIKSERESAYKRMKQKGSRKSFDWYYGSQSKVIYYLLPIILVPLAAFIGYLFATFFMQDTINELVNVYLQEGLEVPVFLEYANIVIPIGFAAIIGIVFLIIELIRKFRHYFRWWYLFLAISFFSVLVVILSIAVIPYYGYCIYQVFILKGKNRK